MTVNKPQRLVTRDLSFAVNNERFFTKAKKGWKLLWGSLKSL